MGAQANLAPERPWTTTASDAALTATMDSVQRTSRRLVPRGASHASEESPTRSEMDPHMRLLRQPRQRRNEVCLLLQLQQGHLPQVQQRGAASQTRTHGPTHDTCLGTYTRASCVLQGQAQRGHHPRQEDAAQSSTAPTRPATAATSTRRPRATRNTHRRRGPPSKTFWSTSPTFRQQRRQRVRAHDMRAPELRQHHLHVPAQKPAWKWNSEFHLQEGILTRITRTPLQVCKESVSIRPIADAQHHFPRIRPRR